MKNLFEGVKEVIGNSLDSFQGFLEKTFASAKNKEAINRIFNDLRKMVGLKSKNQLEDLKQEVESGISKISGKNTLIFGDSIAVGLSSVVSNLSGGKSVEGLRSSQILRNLKSFIGDMKGKYVPLISGFNDLVGGERFVKPAVSNVEAMVKEVKSKGGVPVLTKLYLPNYKTISKEDVQAYNSQIEAIAKKYNVKLVDLSKANLSLGNDGLHLTRNGYESMWDFITKEVG